MEDLNVSASYKDAARGLVNEAFLEVAELLETRTKYYIVVGVSYEGAGDNEFAITCITTDYQEAKEAFEKKREFCEENKKVDTAWTHIYELRYYSTTSKGYLLYDVLDKCDDIPEDCRPENLRALCQRCHNQYDAKHRAETRKETIRRRLCGIIEKGGCDGK